MKRQFTISERRTRGPRKSRVRVGPRPLIWFVVLAVLTAVAGLWIERHYETIWTRPPGPPHVGFARLDGSMPV
jgi:hypothetical protein